MDRSNLTIIVLICLTFSLMGCGDEGDSSGSDISRSSKEYIDTPPEGYVPPAPEAVPDETPSKAEAEEAQKRAEARVKARAEAAAATAERKRQAAKVAAERTIKFKEGKVQSARLLLASAKSSSRVRGIRTLDNIHSAGALETFLLFIVDDDPSVAAEAKLFLGRWGDKQVTDALFEVEGTDVPRRVAAMQTLGMCDRRHVDEDRLISLFSDKVTPPEVRAAAASSAGRLLVWKALKPLIDLMEDPNALVRKGAYDGVSQLIDKQFVFQPAGDAKNREAQVKAFRRFWADSKKQALIQKSVKDRQNAVDRRRGNG